MPASSRTASAYLALIVAAASWGGATALTKGLLTHASPIGLLIVQLIGSCLCLWLIWCIRHRSAAWRVLRGPWSGATELPWRVGLLGVLNPGLSYALSLFGLTTTSASLSALLWATEPAWIILLAAIVLGERVGWVRTGCIALALVGVVLAGDLLGLGLASSGLAGQGLILAGVVCCAVYTVLTPRWVAHDDVLLIVAWQQTLALAFAVILWPIDWVLGAGEPTPWTGATLFWAGFSGVIYYGLAFVAFLHGLSRVPAGTAGAFVNLVPIFAIAAATVFLGETLAFSQVLGAGLVLLSVFGLLWLDG